MHQSTDTVKGSTTTLQDGIEHNVNRRHKKNSVSQTSVVSEIERSAEWTAIAAANDHRLRVPYYCEENVWRLAYRRNQGKISLPCRSNSSSNKVEDRTISTGHDFVVFVSNPMRHCPFYHQKAAIQHESDRDKVVFWDYHVILVNVKRLDKDEKVVDDGVQKKTGEAIETTNTVTPSVIAQVFDMDSTLPYPCSLSMYLAATFRTNSIDYTDPEFQNFEPMFRVIPAEDFLRQFYSDRSHMFDAEVQRWSAPPPKYNCILNGYSKDFNTEDEKAASNNGEAHSDVGHPSQVQSRSNLKQYITFENEEAGLDSDNLSYDSIMQKRNGEGSIVPATESHDKEAVCGKVVVLENLESYFLNSNE